MINSTLYLSHTEGSVHFKCLLLLVTLNKIDFSLLKRCQGEYANTREVKKYLEEDGHSDPETAESHEEEAADHQGSSAQTLDGETL